MYFIYKMKLPKAINNKYVLYTVLILAIINAVCLLQERDYDSLLMLAVIGVLMTYFTKNMIVVLVVAMTVANSNYIQDNINYGIMEGFQKGKGGVGKSVCWKHNDEKTDWVMSNKKSESSCVKPMCWAKSKDQCGVIKKKQGFGQRNVPKSQPVKVSVDDESEEERIDYAATLEGAYENLQGMLGDEGMKGLTNETKKLVAQQKGLMESLKGMTPVLKSAKETLDGLDMPDVKGLKDVMAKLQGGAKKKKD
jgi:hypothetical protein